MKTKVLLITAFGCVTLFTSCLKELFTETGGTIRFGVSTYYTGSPDTKTEYSGKDQNGNPIHSGSTAERIDWLDTDEITIYSDKAYNNYGDYFDTYKIKPGTISGRNHYATITPVDDASGGLMWGSGQHSFWAVYPSEYNWLDVLSSRDDLYVNAEILSLQRGTMDGYVYKPDMNYAYMYAGTTASAGGNVSLDFKPLFTAVEFKLLAREGHAALDKLQYVELHSPSYEQPLAGEFTALISSSQSKPIDFEFGDNDELASGYVRINLPSGGIQLSSDPDKAYTVTFLLLPKDHTNLTLRLYFADGTSINLPLEQNGVPITIPACKKTYFRNVDAPVDFVTRSMTLVVTVEKPNSTYFLPFRIAGGNQAKSVQVDWGDGSPISSLVTNYRPNGGTYSEHKYSSVGDYEITIMVTQRDGLYDLPTYQKNTPHDAGVYLKAFTSPLLKLRPSGRFSSFNLYYTDYHRTFFGMDTFSGEDRLISIHEDLLVNNPDFPLDFLFNGCKSLKGYGWTLGADEETGLTKGLPENLFANQQNATSFIGTFRRCTSLESIPENLFANNPKAKNFVSTFYACTALTAIPENLFANNPQVECFYATFAECPGLTAIPENIFANNPLANDFTATFAACRGLTAIPGNLFANNPKVERFYGTFAKCTGLRGPIPENLFANNPLARDFGMLGFARGHIDYSSDNPNNHDYFDIMGDADARDCVGTFFMCSGLEGPIPENLFANNPLAEGFVGTFAGCSGLTGPIPENLFANNPLVLDFTGVFAGCSSLEGPIPENLFASNQLALRFGGVFSQCSNIGGTIPERLFANNPQAYIFGTSSIDCRRDGDDRGTNSDYKFPPNMYVSQDHTLTQMGSNSGHRNYVALENKLYYDGCFSGCSSLTGSIPENLFANNPKALRFDGVFRGCNQLTGSIPENLFANNPEVETFSGTFDGCSNLSGSIPGNLFANNPQVISFAQTFRGTKSLETAEGGLFARNLQVYTFFSCFYDTGAALSEDLFLDGSVTKATRFANPKPPYFDKFYRSLPLTRPVYAVDLWNYTFPIGLPPTYYDNNIALAYSSIIPYINSVPSSWLYNDYDPNSNDPGSGLGP